MIGYIIWFFVISAIDSIPEDIGKEVNYGTFEHLHLSCSDIKSILLVRAFINALKNIFYIAIIVSLIHRVTIISNPLSFLIFFILVFGLYGFAFMLAGLVLVVKSMGNWLGVLNLILLIPLIIQEKLLTPEIKEILSYFPIHQGASLIKKINNVENIPFSSLSLDISKLVISSLIFFILGILIFDIADKNDKKKRNIRNVLRGKLWKIFSFPLIMW